MEALNKDEHEFLATYVQEQSQLRITAAALLDKGRPMREQHARLLEEQRLALVVLQEEQRRRLEEVEGPLRVANLELQQAFAKMYALKTENEARLQQLRKAAAEKAAAEKVKQNNSNFYYIYIIRCRKSCSLRPR
jgi:hypothetical protein